MPAELLQTGGETLVSVIHKLMNSIWNKEELPDQWKESIIYQFTKTMIKVTNNYCTAINFIRRFEVFRAVTMKNGAFWGVTPCVGISSHRASFPSYS
jgi:hypothetical protein